MKHVLKGLVVAVAVAALVGVFLAVGYTQTVSEEVTKLRRESRSDLVYLRTRVRELESELTASLLDRLESPDQAVDGVVDEETDAGTSETETEPVTEDVNDSEEVTVPTHNSPETQEPNEESTETDAPAAMYILTVYNGVIGVFDASGELVRTINCFVMTLPEAEQEALAVGIPAYSEAEMLALAGQYE